MSKKGFSLIELLVYVSIFAVVAGLMTAVLITILKVNQEESASVETSEQLSFVMQTISRLIRESSNIETASANSLKLRMKDSAKDPTCLYLENQTIKIIEGPDPSNPQNCNLNASSSLTSAKVIADKLEFSKISNYPGHDVVSVDIQLTYNSNNPQSQATRNLKSAIARVSAATFDSNVLPGGSYNYNLGQVGSPWQKIIMADGTALNPSYTFGSDTSLGLFKNANFLGFATAGLERMIINSSGNIGIGTSTPSSLLNAYLTGAGATGLGDIVRLARSGNEPTMLIESMGGLGSNPYMSFVTNGNIGFITGDSNLNDDARFDSKMVIKTDGNVGIGTTAPNYRLQITGGDAYTSSAGNGLIVKSPNGAICRRIGIDNTGALQLTTPATCP